MSIVLLITSDESMDQVALNNPHNANAAYNNICLFNDIFRLPLSLIIWSARNINNNIIDIIRSVCIFELMNQKNTNSIYRIICI